MAKKKWKKIAKKVAKTAVLAGALYGGSKLLKGKGNKLKGDATLSTDRFFPKAYKHDLESYKPKFKHPPGNVDPGATLAAKGGRIGKRFGGGLGSTARRDMRSGYYPSDMGMRGGTMYKKGGRVKSMGKATRGGGVAKR